jgi:uncharacterized membrane-anchored protein YitT (DUF2179 family)
MFLLELTYILTIDKSLKSTVYIQNIPKMSKELITDLQQLLTAIKLAQSRGAYKLEESEALSKNVRNINTYIKENSTSS